MKRALITHIFVLVLSLATTVAISWLCAAFIPDPLVVPLPTYETPSLTGAPEQWGEPTLREAGRRAGLAVAEETWMLVHLEGHGSLLTPRAAAEIRADAGLDRPVLNDRVLVTRRRTEAGFPFRSLRWTRCDLPPDDELPDGLAPPIGPVARGLLGLDSAPMRALGVKSDRRLPIEPIWPGLALGTLLAAVPIWLLLVGLPALRRRRRIARGRCPACGYPAGPSAACSECGAPLRSAPVVGDVPAAAHDRA